MIFTPLATHHAIAAALLAAPVSAAAGPGWLDLRWPDVPGCPSRGDVEAATARLVTGADPQPVVAAAQIARDAAGYTLDLSVRDPGGDAQQRTLHSPECQPLADATAVILAVAAGPRPAVSPSASAPTTDLELPAEPGPPPAPVPTRPTPSLGLFAHLFAALGPAQRFTPGLAGGLAVTWPRVRLDLRGAYLFPGPVRRPDAPTIGADLRLAAAAARGCPRLVRRALALRLCAGLEVGALLARGVGLERNDDTRGVWAAGLLAPGLAWQPLRWLALDLEVEGVLAITRRQLFVRDDPEALYTVPAVGVRLGGGLTVIFF